MSNTVLYLPDIKKQEQEKIEQAAFRQRVTEAQEIQSVAIHGSDHISAGSDEIDGDQLDIDWVPTEYTPNTGPAEVTLSAHLTAHLRGIELALGDTLPKDGSENLTGDWDIGNGRRIEADEIRARDADGLKLYEDGGTGLFVENGGNVGVGTTAPFSTVSNTTSEPTAGTTAAGGFSWFLNEAGYTIGVRNSTGGGLRVETSAAAAFPLYTYDSGASQVGLAVKETDVGVGTDAPSGKLHVDQSSTIEQIPVLYLDQADLSEEFIRFDATVADSNPISTKMVGSYYGKVRVNTNGTDRWLPLYNDDSTGDWTAASYDTGWGDLGGANQVVEYRKVGDVVSVRGLPERTTGSTVQIFTLPSGFRPPVNRTLPCWGSISTAIGEVGLYLWIKTDGTVNLGPSGITSGIVNNENWFTTSFDFSINS